MDVNNKVIAITGGAKGIGFAIAAAIVAKQGHVAILDLDETLIKEAISQLQSSGSTVKGYVCNVTDETAVEQTFAQINQDFGAIHGLVNNAGILRDSQLLKVEAGKVTKKMTAQQFDQVIDVHLKGAFLCTREAATHMVENGVDDACIISMSSVAFRGNFGQTNYSAAKAGIVAMSRVWAKELAKYNIRSMAIAPGSIDTDMLASMPPKALQMLAAHVPLGRIGKTDNIAQAAISILENDYLNGNVIEVNGGLMV